MIQNEKVNIISIRRKFAERSIERFMANKQNNATLVVKENGKFINLYVSFSGKNGEIIDFPVNPVAKDKKTLAKLLYKIKKNLE